MSFSKNSTTSSQRTPAELQQRFTFLTSLFHFLIPLYGEEYACSYVQFLSDMDGPWFSNRFWNATPESIQKLMFNPLEERFKKRVSPTVFVSNLPENISVAALRIIFESVGHVHSVRVSRDGHHAYVTYFFFEVAELAVERLNFYSSELTAQQQLYVEWAEYDSSKRNARDTKVFIKGLDTSITESMLYDTFSQFGAVRRCDLRKDKVAGCSLGYGYILFETKETAQAAVAKVNGMKLKGKQVQLSPFLKRWQRLQYEKRHAEERSSRSRKFKSTSCCRSPSCITQSQGFFNCSSSDVQMEKRRNLLDHQVL